MKKYTFYKKNILAGNYELTLEEIKAKYKKWLVTKEASWITYYGHHTVKYFITDAGEDLGLASLINQPELRELESELMAIRHELPIYKKAAE